MKFWKGHTIHACICVCIAAWALPAAAQGSDKLPSLEQLLSAEVVTASRFAQAQTQAPASVEVITADQIRALGYRSLTDALRGVAGIHITNDHYYEYVGVNGLSNLADYNSRILVLLDGARLNEPLYDQGPLGWLLPVDLMQVERIEFVRGPGSSLYGSNALYGVINIITKRAAQNAAGLVSGTYGLKELRTSLAGEAAVATRYQITASRHVKRGQTFTYEEFAQPGESAPSVSLDRERATRLYASIGTDSWTLRYSYVSRYKQGPTAAYGAVFGDPRNDARDTYAITDLSGTMALNGSIQWSNRLLIGNYRYRGLFPYESAPDVVSLSIDDGAANWVNVESVLGYTFNADYRLLGGIELQRNTKIAQRNFNEGEPAFLDDKRQTTRRAAFAQLEAALSPVLRGYAGVRIDNSDGNRTASPRLAMIWRVGESLTVRASSARAFRPPNAYESYYSYPSTGPDVVATTINPQLKPETLVQSEIAADYLPSPTLKLTGALFTAKSRNQISYRIEELTAQFQNTQGVSTLGLRAGVEGVAAGGGRFKLGMSRQDARDVSSERLRLNAPRLTAQAQLISPIANGWTLGAELLYVGSRRGKTSIVPAYSLLNLTLSKLDVMRDLDLTVSVLNATDKRYFDPAGDEAVQERLEQEGRVLRLQVEYRF
jgi:outer membrane receptor for ferrienterochelin and colicin